MDRQHVATLPLQVSRAAQPVPCPVPGCGLPLALVHIETVIAAEPPDIARFNDRVLTFSHEGAERHTLTIWTPEPLPAVLDRLAGTLDEMATLMWTD